LRLSSRCLFSGSSGRFCAPSVGASSTLKAPPRWGLGYDYQMAPPWCPNRLYHLAQQGRKAASPAIKGTLSSTHKLET
jgi:hypothetical protein